MEKEELEKRLKWYDKKYGPYIGKRGLHNWRNLLRTPTISEWTILFMLLMMGFVAWAYLADTEQCMETLNNLEVVCIDYCTSEFSIAQAEEGANEGWEALGDIDFSSSIVKADNVSLNDSG